MKWHIFLCASVMGSICLMDAAIAQEQHFLTSPPPENKHMKPEETEYYSPVPPVVTPGNACGEAPSDAIMLFDGKDLHNWVSANDTTKPAAWTVHDGVMTVKPGTGNIQTRSDSWIINCIWNGVNPWNPQTM